MSKVPKIRAVERYVVQLPFTPRTTPWNDLLVGQWRVCEVVRVLTDTPHLVGFGETILHYTWGQVSDTSVARAIGRSPADLLGDDTLGAGLQMAVYDLMGKALEVPVYKLFNLPQVRTWCPLAWWNTKMPPEVLAEEAKEAAARGYTAHKFKARPWLDVYAQVEAVSAVTPPHYRLEPDWNGMLLHVGNAAPVLAALSKYERVALFESPIPHEDAAGNRALRRTLTRPLALHFGEPPFPDALDLCDGFVVSWAGVSGLLRQGILASAFNKPFFLQMVGAGLTTALALHLGAVLPLAQWPAVTGLNIYEHPLLTRPIEVVGGYARVPEAPGLGVEVDENALERYRMSPPFEVRPPKVLLRVRWPSGRTHLYADAPSLWQDALAGNVPPQEHGVQFSIHPDDGSSDWAELYARAQHAPVYDWIR